MAILSFWLNAFMPKNVPGYTVTISKGIHRNKTAIPLPVLARLCPFNTFKDMDCGYLTDQRSFDGKVAAPSRMTSLVEIDLQTMKITQRHSSSGTTEVNLISGEQTGWARANMGRCSFEEVKPLAVPGNNVIRCWGLKAAAGDPLVNMAADIDYRGVLQVRGRTSDHVYEVHFRDTLIAFLPMIAMLI